MPDLEISDRALADLDAIYDYGVERWGLAQAERYGRRLVMALKSLPDAPTRAARVRAVYGDGPSRQARPSANRGDNLTAGSPYQDAPAPVGAAFGLGRKGA